MRRDAILVVLHKELTRIKSWSDLDFDRNDLSWPVVLSSIIREAVMYPALALSVP
jgi:hypothetical protein